MKKSLYIMSLIASLFSFLGYGCAKQNKIANNSNRKIMKMNIKGKDIVIIDPVYIVKDNDEWQKFIVNLDPSVMGYSDALIADLSDYHQTEILDSNGNIIGEWCSDSNLLGCFLFDEVIANSEKFVEDKDCWSNYCVIIRNFTGEVSFITETRRFPMDFIREGEYDDADVLTIKGVGSPSFESKYVSNEEFCC